MLHDLLTVFVRGLIWRDGREAAADRMVAALLSMLNLPAALQLNQSELDRYEQLVMQRGGSDPLRNLTGATVDLAELIQLLVRPSMAPIDMLYQLRLVLLQDFSEDQARERLADLYTFLLDLRQVQALPRNDVFDAYAHWRNLRNADTAALTDHVLAISQHVMGRYRSAA